MALDATPGSPNATSYVTISEADIYFRDRLHAENWESLDYVKKSSALITATSMLDWYMNWEGSRASTTQSLDWPRINVIGEDGISIPSDVIPIEVKIATYELSFSIIEEDRTTDWELAGLSKVKTGTLEIQTANQTTNPYKNTIPDKIYKILSNVIVSSGGSGIRVVRLVRA